MYEYALFLPIQNVLFLFCWCGHVFLSIGALGPDLVLFFVLVWSGLVLVCFVLSCFVFVLWLSCIVLYACIFFLFPCLGLYSCFLVLCDRVIFVIVSPLGCLWYRVCLVLPRLSPFLVLACLLLSCPILSWLGLFWLGLAWLGFSFLLAPSRVVFSLALLFSCSSLLLPFQIDRVKRQETLRHTNPITPMTTSISSLPLSVPAPCLDLLFSWQLCFAALCKVAQTSKVDPPPNTRRYRKTQHKILPSRQGKTQGINEIHKTNMIRLTIKTDHAYTLDCFYSHQA